MAIEKISIRILFFFLLVTPAASAQSPTPTPANDNVANADALTNLVIVAGNLIPRVQETVESPLVGRLENLAFWIAVVVMMFSFARLFRENDGATKDLFWWCFRLAVVFTLFGTGRAIINTWGEIGYDIVNMTEFRKTLWDAEIEFNTNYEKFTEGMFLVKATSATDAIAALTTDDVNLRNIADAAANPSAWNLPNIFIGVTIARATAMREANDRQARAHQILGLHSAAASRDQSLGAIKGSYEMALKMNEAQRQATTDLIERSRDQQVIGILADRSFGQRQAGILASREERDLRLTQGQQNLGTALHRGLDIPDHLAGSLSRLGGEGAPLLPALGEATKIVTGPMRGAADISLNNTTTDAKVNSVRIAAQSQFENYESTTKMREHASDIYAHQATLITNQQAAANNAASRANRNLAAGGVESAYRKQLQGVAQAYQLNLDANQINLSGALKAAEIMRSSGMKAVKLDQMSQIVSTLSRDLARRTEMAMTLRY